MKSIWQDVGKMMSTMPRLTPAQEDSIFSTIKHDVDNIKARGGQVLFVRTPSSGAYLMGEKMGFPREK